MAQKVKGCWPNVPHVSDAAARSANGVALVVPNYARDDAACGTQYMLARKPGMEFVSTHSSMQSLAQGMPAAAAGNSGEWFSQNVSIMNATPQNQDLLVPGTTKRAKNVCAAYWAKTLGAEGGMEVLEAETDVLVSIMCMHKPDAFLGITGLDALGKFGTHTLPVLERRYAPLHEVVMHKQLRVVHVQHVENVADHLRFMQPSDIQDIARMVCEAGRLADVACNPQFLFDAVCVTGGPRLLAGEPNGPAWLAHVRALMQRSFANGSLGGDKINALVAQGFAVAGKAAVRAKARAALEFKGLGCFVDRDHPEHAMHAQERLRALHTCKTNEEYVTLVAVNVTAGRMLAAGVLHARARAGARIAGDADILDGALKLLLFHGDGMFVPSTHPQHAFHARARELQRALCATQDERDVLVAMQVLAGNIMGGQIGGKAGAAALHASAAEGRRLVGDDAILKGALELLSFDGLGKFVPRSHPEHEMHAAERARQLAACAPDERCVLLAKQVLAGNIMGGQVAIAALHASAAEGARLVGDDAILKGALELLSFDGLGKFVPRSHPEHEMHAAERARQLAACAPDERCVLLAKQVLAGNIMGGTLGATALNALAAEGERLAGDDAITAGALQLLRMEGLGKMVPRAHPDHKAHAAERARQLAACATHAERAIMAAKCRRAGNLMGSRLGGAEMNAAAAEGLRIAGKARIAELAAAALAYEGPGRFVGRDHPEHAMHAAERARQLASCSRNDYCIKVATFRQAGGLMGGKLGSAVGGARSAVSKGKVVAAGKLAIAAAAAAGGLDLQARIAEWLDPSRPGHYVPTDDPSYAAQLKARKAALKHCSSYCEYSMMVAAMWGAARIAAGRARGTKRMPDALRGEPLHAAAKAIIANPANVARLQSITAPANVNMRALGVALCAVFGPGGTQPTAGWLYTEQDCKHKEPLYDYLLQNLPAELKLLPGPQAALKKMVNDVSKELAKAAYGALGSYDSMKACRQVFSVIAERTAATAAAAGPGNMAAQALAAAAQAQAARGPTKDEAHSNMQRQDYHAKRSTSAKATKKK